MDLSGWRWELHLIQYLTSKVSGYTVWNRSVINQAEISREALYFFTKGILSSLNWQVQYIYKLYAYLYTLVILSVENSDYKEIRSGFCLSIMRLFGFEMNDLRS